MTTEPTRCLMNAINSRRGPKHRRGKERKRRRWNRTPRQTAWRARDCTSRHNALGDKRLRRPACRRRGVRVTAAGIPDSFLALGPVVDVVVGPNRQEEIECKFTDTASLSQRGLRSEELNRVGPRNYGLSAHRPRWHNIGPDRTMSASVFVLRLIASCFQAFR